MKKFFAVIACLSVSLLLVQSLHSEEEAKEKQLLCPVSGKAVNMEQKVAYKNAEVYFCCGNCLAAFKEDPSKFAVKANHQLVASGQYEEVKCPLSGGKLNPDTAVTVADVEVTFCCNNCKGKVEGEADGDAKLALVFSDAAFEKGFAKKKAKRARD
ncbi:MAG: hypothetical protein R3C11_06440 [Planctomycetaceae bacterium]